MYARHRKEIRMTFQELAQIVADEFNKYMDEHDFDDFDEMKQCYWWDSKDIKDEVDAIIRIETNERAYIDELDRTDVFLEYENAPQGMMSYREFSRMWHKLLRVKGDQDDRTRDY